MGRDQPAQRARREQIPLPAARMFAAGQTVPTIAAQLDLAVRTWLRIYQLPSYAPELNAAENMWSSLKGSLANRAPCTVKELLFLIKNRLK